MSVPETACYKYICIRQEDFNLQTEQEKVIRHSRNTGAVVAFTGLCRDENSTLTALEIEHYAGMAEAEINRIADIACKRWPLSALTIIHRYGLIKAGEQIVLVITASAHRQAAFEAVDFIMDYLKIDAPFWKKEHRPDRTATDWVRAHERDYTRRNRWQADPSES